jgi:hypothetical protein
MFACGWSFCGVDQYCRQLNSDTGDPPTFACAPLPAGCDPANAGCGCLASDPCAAECEVDDGGHLTVTCLGG